jgi:steroid delta-isomerase-like uncharacterized protein
MNSSLQKARDRRVDQHLDAENQHEMELVTIDFGENASCDDVASNQHAEGPEGIRQWYKDIYAAAPDLRIEELGRTEHGDHVTIDCMLHGTHKGTWHGVRATGTSFHVPAQVTYEFRHGSDFLKHETIDYDRSRLLEQFGVTGRRSRVQH